MVRSPMIGQRGDINQKGLPRIHEGFACCAFFKENRCEYRALLAHIHVPIILSGWHSTVVLQVLKN